MKKALVTALLLAGIPTTVGVAVRYTFSSPLSVSGNAVSLSLAGTGGVTVDGGTVSCSVATDAGPGCLAAADWTTFNGKQAALTGANGINVSGGTVSIDGGATFTGAVSYNSGGNGVEKITDVSGYPGLWMGATNAGTPSTNNYAILYDTGSGETLFNGPSYVGVRVNNADKIVVSSSNVGFKTGVTLGASGTAISTSVGVTASIDVGSISANTCLDTSQAITGASNGSPCVVTPSNPPAANVVFSCYMSANDTAQLRACNVSTAPVDPAAVNYTFRVFNP